jgi:Ca-activated chloride channel family protein
VLLAISVVCLAVAAFDAPSADERGAGRESGALVFVLDVSRSMDARDIDPSRRTAMFRLVRQAVRDLPGRAVGIVAVAGEPVVLCPLTTDSGALEMAVVEAENDVDLPGGSALSDGVSAALDVAGAASVPTIVVLTDGEETAGAWDPVLSRIGREHGHLIAVGIGTAKGALMRVDRGAVNDIGGATRTTRLGDEVLRRVSERTGGQYLQWSSNVERELITATGRTASSSSRPMSPWPARSRWLIVTAFVCLSVEWARPRSLRPR